MLIEEFWFFIFILGIILDQLLGEPSRFHPLVGFGRWVSRLERVFNRKTNATFSAKILGVLALLLAVSPILAVWQLWSTLYSDSENSMLDGVRFVLLSGSGAQYTETALHFLYLVSCAVLLYLCIGRHSLIAHAMAIYTPLKLKQKEEARTKLSLIVSRDTSAMNEQQIVTGTIESVLENGNDGVFAPLFWFLVGGIPGVLFYRMVNTLDAMWGYKTDRYLHFGWAAARLDDVLNWIPARVSALFYALLGRTGQAIKCWHAQARFCESPNGGVVMCTGAGALDIKLGGTAVYHGQVKNKPAMGSAITPGVDDILRAINLVNMTTMLWVLTAAILWGGMLAFSI
ncbi:cobalamin biosynthesis protein CobD/CbiB [Oleiphilus messinensis]|uniref:Cobalamin biosynthesis protein CobD n=1 Tax=Oleiphilus messinensis TaxID=141451 RepID=A0A1Y0IBG0_9GAMM|nr:adenosylcobinamide-phosphate synthase CbiB [Oleiphilus messinensis]ARU56795.1 cobalamin biosynthesis protein CobD/CbiB [Oleiphilus messinensis]